MQHFCTSLFWDFHRNSCNYFLWSWCTSCTRKFWTVLQEELFNCTFRSECRFPSKKPFKCKEPVDNLTSSILTTVNCMMQMQNFKKIRWFNGNSSFLFSELFSQSLKSEFRKNVCRGATSYSNFSFILREYWNYLGFFGEL